MSEPDPIAAALDNPAPAPLLAEAGDPGPDMGRGKSERPPFPPRCPVKPLGIQSGLDGTMRCYYLDVLGQIVGLEAGNRHGKNSLIALFGDRSDWLEESFPQWSAPQYEGRGKERRLVKDPEIVGFDQAEASRALIEECVRKGIFDPAGRMRGRGAHPMPGGGIVFHFGDRLLTSRHKADGTFRDFVWHDTGVFEKNVYPAASPIPHPHHEGVGPKAAIALIGLLRTWRWKRGDLDVRLVLGAIGAGLVGGALPWRPNVWITGGRGTGKSTLNGEHGVVPQLFGEGLFRTGNASAAAIRQSLKNSTVPVMFDEIEPGADNRRVNEVIELARVASSGDKIHRGGQDHQAHEFTLRSSFWFSSINIPPLQPQDRSRLAILELRPFAPNTPPPPLAKFNFAQMGCELHRRMIDGWPRLAETKERFHAALAAAGHDARACDQFGTLLACADLLTEDDVPDDDDTAYWAEQCAPHKMAEVSEATADENACIEHLLTSLVQARGGDERESLGTWVGKAVANRMAPLFSSGDEDKDGARLEQLGLKLVNAKYHPEERALDGSIAKPARWGAATFLPAEPGFLAVANNHQALAGLYGGTKWQGGVWRQSLARVEGCIEPVKVKFGRQAANAVLVPLDVVLDESELPDASQAKASRAWVAAQLAGEGAA